MSTDNSLSKMSPGNKSNIRWIEAAQAGHLGQDATCRCFIKGLTTTLRHLFFVKKITLQSPEERHKIVNPLSTAACIG